MKYIVLSFLLLSCTHLTKTVDCAEINWCQQGREDALNGLLEDLNQAKCLGEERDTDQYKLGYAEGIKVFCQPQSALYFGLKGSEYKQNCPISLNSSFVSEYERGKSIFLIQRDINILQAEINRERSKRNNAVGSYHVQKSGHNLQEKELQIKKLLKQLEKINGQD